MDEGAATVRSLDGRDNTFSLLIKGRKAPRLPSEIFTDTHHLPDPAPLLRGTRSLSQCMEHISVRITEPSLPTSGAKHHGLLFSPFIQCAKYDS